MRTETRAEFIKWLMEEMTTNGWTNSELARRAGVVPSTVSMVLSRRQRPGLEFCVGIARALHVPPEEVLRLAGLLPPLPSTVEEEEEIIAILRSLPANIRAVVLLEMRGLKEQLKKSKSKSS
jgi:transcriptional regulator with XRE-family HTH domain